MREKLILLFTFVLVSCSTGPVADTNPTLKEAPKAIAEAPSKEFDRGEVIIATDLLVKIFDKEMAPVACVPDHEEAELLLRTIRPRMEMVEDDLGAMLDNKDEVKKLIKSCDQSCTCLYLDDLLREHMVVLGKEEAKMMAVKKSKKEANRCMKYAQETFCQGELYKALNKEKVDFTFDEESL